MRQILLPILTLSLMTMGCLSAERQCGFDSDCFDGAEACVQGACLTRCTQNVDCGDVDDPSAPICQAVVRQMGEAEINVCVTPTPQAQNNTENNSAGDCTDDAQCRERLGDERAQCSLSGTCILAAEQHALLITSREETPDLRGPQLLAAYLADESGTPLGYAVEEVYDPAGLAMSTLDLMGQALETQAQGLCVPGAASAPVVELGAKGGSLRVHFIDAAGARLLITPERQVVIVTKSQMCGMWAQPSEYELQLCVSPQGETIQEEIHCAQPVGEPMSESARFNVTSR